MGLQAAAEVSPLALLSESRTPSPLSSPASSVLPCPWSAVANCLLEVLPHQHSQAAQQIWDRMSQQMAACAECINGYHTAQQELFQDFQHTSRLLGVLQQLDKQRLLSWVAAAQQQPADAGVGAADAAALGTTQLHALFELLGYAAYLDDAALCAATVALLDQVAWDIELSDSTPTTGLFRLLAHPDAGVRSKVGDVRGGGGSS